MPDLAALMAMLGQSGGGESLGGLIGLGGGASSNAGSPPLATGGFGGNPQQLGPVAPQGGVLGGMPQMAQANQGIPAPLGNNSTGGTPQQGPGAMNALTGFSNGVKQANQGFEGLGYGGQSPLDPMLLRLLGL